MSGLRIKVGSQEETLLGAPGELPEEFTSVRIEKVPGDIISAETLSGTYAEAGTADVVIASADSPLQTGGAFHAGHGEVPDETPRTIGELMVFDYPVSVDAPDDAKKLEGYLAWKWGIQDQLPASHPYRNAAPEIVVHTAETDDRPAERNTYRRWLPDHVPGWLQGAVGRAWHFAIGDVLDGVSAWATAALKSSWPDYATDEGLACIGSEYGLSRGAGETSDAFAGRLKGALDAWDEAGTAKALLEALRPIVPQGQVRLQLRDGRTALLMPDGRLVLGPARKTAGGERPVCWTTAGDVWQGFQVMVLGRGEAPAPDGLEADALRTAIRAWKGAHAWCSGIVLENGYCWDGDEEDVRTPRMVDWPVRAMDALWAQDMAEDAWFDAPVDDVNASPRSLWNVSETGAGTTCNADDPPKPDSGGGGGSTLLEGIVGYWGFGADELSGGVDLTNAVDGSVGVPTGIAPTSAADGLVGAGIAGLFTNSGTRSDCRIRLLQMPETDSWTVSRWGNLDSNFYCLSLFSTTEDMRGLIKPTWGKYDANHVNLNFDGAFRFTGTLPATGWANVVVAREGRTTSLFVNGVLQDQQELPAFGIGGRYFGIDFMASARGMVLDEVGVWSRALTAEEVQKLYDAGQAGVSYPFEGY